MTVVDLFAGPGGWDLGASRLGIRPVGVEWEPDACATRAAAGHATIRANLADYPAPADIDGLIGSPPCPMFSAAGKREGVDWLPHLCEVAAGATELSPDAPAEATLSLKPLEWALTGRPTWICLEQVPDVIVLWKAIAGRLGNEGWSTWTGVLNAVNHGVPQTRRRAILIARRDAPAQPPEPTHAQDPQPSLFGPELKPWVTMAEALGICAINTGLDWKPGGTREDEDAASWVWERPATTLAGDPRVWPPGHKINQADIDRLGPEAAAERYGDRAGTEAIRLTPAQAAALQTFPNGYPFHGSKTSRFRQIGNAVPPLLAEHIIRAATT